jgi:hypothetical protein
LLPSEEDAVLLSPAGRKKPSSKLPPLETTVLLPEMAELAVMVSDSDAKHPALLRMATDIRSSCPVEEAIGEANE